MLLIKNIFNFIGKFCSSLINLFSLNFILDAGKTSDEEKKSGRTVSALGKESVIDFISLIFDKKVFRGNDAMKNVSGPLFFGTLILIIFFGVFGVWSAVAPLEGAVVAMGEVVSSSHRKIVQHLDGGIIKKILVNAGDSVVEGQPLLYLDSETIKSNLKVLDAKIAYLYAKRDSLIALRNQDRDLTFSASLLNMEGLEDKEKIVSSQRKIFYDQKAVYEGRKSILKNRIEQLEDQLKLAISSEKVAKKQYEIAKADIDAKRKLFKEGYVSKIQMGTFESQYAESEGKAFASSSQVYTAAEKIEESKLQLKDLENDNFRQISDDLNNLESQLSELIAKKNIAEGTRERTVIRSPIKGTVTDIKYHTEGGIISSGSEIMVITPEKDPLVIESKVPTHRIEEILSAQNNPAFVVEKEGVKGLQVRVRLTAYSSRKTGMLQGIAQKVSADSIQDRNGERYYSIRVFVPDTELKKYPGMKMYPGMPAQVMIVTNSRTLLSYLFSPIISTMESAFKER